MSDASKAYTYLCENVSKWQDILVEVRAKISDREDAVAKVAVPANPVLKKSGSTETIRDKIADDENPIALEVTSAPQAEHVTPSAATQQQQALLAKRKRKTASLFSGHMSGPSKYRSRGLIIVYYDSEVQKAFEGLVRNIGAGRNLLRKGKMAARIESLGDLEDSDGDDGDYDTPTLGKIGYRPRLGITQFRTARARAGFGANNDTEATPDQFDATDKALEKAQSLCERGAHQFLREGDCTAELDGCKSLFVEVLNLAQQEAAKYKAKEEQQRVRQEQEKKKRLESEQQQQQQQQQQQRTMDIVPDSSGILEVDDNSDEEEELTLASLRPIRMTSRMAARV